MAGLCKLLPGNYTVMETEIMAVEAGILLAKELVLQQVITETDSPSLWFRVLWQKKTAEKLAILPKEF